ncbi:MAG: hypothetical protein C0191_00530 [Mucilaginibacter sp.]|nr:MAG: hypothetical protein C0191_00530 [Mucilaginibacter sp.]HEK21347.1 DUF305 domain-containing protein [Bacteroidota bacterium]
MKTTILMIPLIALGATGINNSTGMTRHSEVTNIASTIALTNPVKPAFFHGDELMEIMNKMMKDMEAQPMKGNVDLDFASMLKLHHQGAIDMAKVELQDGKDGSMKKMAQKIIDMQTKEVADLDQLIASLQSAPKNYDPMNKTAGPAKAMADNMMTMKKMGHMSMGSVDHEFADMMIKHHSDGVAMAKSIIAFSKTVKLRSMAQKSIPEQGTQIKEFKQWTSQHKG